MLKILLIVDHYLYKIITILAIRKFKIHPKHEIINYELWYHDHLNEEDVVLDIGCKNGELLEKVSEKVQGCYGLEIESSVATKTAKRLSSLGNVSIIAADATRFDYSSLVPIPGVITLSNVLEHIEDRVSFLSGILKPYQKNGLSFPRFLIRVPAYDREWVVGLKKKLDVPWKLDNTHYLEYTDELLIKEFELLDYKCILIERKWGEIYAEFHKN
jgi:2-polyprenyl-3-methyl-5-hydroxy-6-metoxy-1,4-benzoquinol methylase